MAPVGWKSVCLALRAFYLLFFMNANAMLFFVGFGSSASSSGTGFFFVNGFPFFLSGPLLSRGSH